MRKGQTFEALTRLPIRRDLIILSASVLVVLLMLVGLPAQESSTRQPGARTTFAVHGVEFALRWVPPSPATNNEGFWISETPITQAQYQAVMSTNPSHFSNMGGGRSLVQGLDTARHPVENVSWITIMGDQTSVDPTPLPGSFLAVLREKTGRNFHLPTERQWTIAAQAGTSTRFYTGDSEADLQRAAWYVGNAGGRTHEVGRKEPNAYGIHDMYGNVYEWTRTRQGNGRIIRGGSYQSGFADLHTPVTGIPAAASSYIGFRVMISGNEP